MKPRFFLAALTLLSALASPAAAEGPVSDADKAQARDLVHAGLTALRAGDFAAAQAAFAGADRLFHAPTTLLGVARASAGLGKLVAAQEAYQRLVREPLAAGAPAAFVNAVEDGKKEAAALSPRIPFVVIQVRGPKEPRVTLDGEPLPQSALGLRRPVDPGKHIVAASADDYVPATAEVVTVSGAPTALTVTLTLSPEAPRPSAPPSSGSPTPSAVVAPTASREAPPPGSPSGRKTIAYAALGVGGLGVVVGAIAGYLALSKRSQLQAECTGGVCPASAAPLHEQYTTRATISTIGFAAAFTGGAVGLTFLLTEPKSPAVALQLQPGISSSGAFLTGDF